MLRRRFFLVPPLLVAGACSRAVTRPDGGKGHLPVGAPAPEVVAEAPDGSAARLSLYKGRAAVVYFYPKDDTPGCTKEACAFRDAWQRFERGGVGVFGVSTDSPASHREFQKKHNLPFPLASDEAGAIGRAYGVPKGLFGLARTSFLVGPDGRIARVFPDVDPGVHADEVLAAAAALGR